MIVLDTTVLVYAVGAEHPLREPCRGLVTAIAERAVEATTSVEVIQELVHVRARYRDRADAAATGRDYADLLSPLIEVGRDDLVRGLEVYERSDGIGAFDAVLAATAANHGATALISADAALAGIDLIEVIAPDDERVAALVGPS